MPAPPTPHSAARPILSAAHVSFAYTTRRAAGSRTLAVDDVSVDVRPGSCTGLLGPNGCGKTTLLKLLGGLLHPRQGVVTLHGRPMGELTRRTVARHIAMVPQETHPAFDYTCMEMVLMGRHPHLGAFQLEGPADVAAARRALRATGSEAAADRRFSTLSGGEKQRVVIAAALAQATEILLLDEPTASLDMGYQLEIAALLRRLSRERNVTLVLATHDLNLAASLCDTLVVMRDGRVLTRGATADVLTADTVRQLYDVRADVTFHPQAGHLTVVPLERL